MKKQDFEKNANKILALAGEENKEITLPDKQDFVSIANRNKDAIKEYYCERKHSINDIALIFLGSNSGNARTVIRNCLLDNGVALQTTARRLRESEVTDVMGAGVEKSQEAIALALHKLVEKLQSGEITLNPGQIMQLATVSGILTDNIAKIDTDSGQQATIIIKSERQESSNLLIERVKEIE